MNKETCIVCDKYMGNSTHRVAGKLCHKKCDNTLKVIADYSDQYRDFEKTQSNDLKNE